MPLEWLTYASAAERLGISPEAIRQKAIRAKWSKRTGNDGRAEIRIDIDEVRAATPPRHQANPVNEPSSDATPTPEQPPVEHLADARTLDALDAHIATLKTMVAKAEETVERERERTAEAEARADRERDRADTEREKAEAVAAKLAVVRANSAEQVAGFERNMAELRVLVDGLQRSWWRRLARG